MHNTNDINITAGAIELADQAGRTAEGHLQAALASVRKVLNTDTPEQYPEIVAALVNAAAADLNTSIACKIAQQNARLIADALRAVEDGIHEAIAAGVHDIGLKINPGE